MFNIGYCVGATKNAKMQLLKVDSKSDCCHRRNQSFIVALFNFSQALTKNKLRLIEFIFLISSH